MSNHGGEMGGDSRYTYVMKTFLVTIYADAEPAKFYVFDNADWAARRADILEGDAALLDPLSYAFGDPPRVGTLPPIIFVFLAVDATGRRAYTQGVPVDTPVVRIKFDGLTMTRAATEPATHAGEQVAP